jgi:hypothetical protein
VLEEDLINNFRVKGKYLIENQKGDFLVKEDLKSHLKILVKEVNFQLIIQ